MKPPGVPSSLLQSASQVQIAQQSPVDNFNAGALTPTDPGSVDANKYALWSADNRAAIKAYNARVEVAGVFSDGLRFF